MYSSAHWKVWSLAGILFVTAVGVEWATGDLDWGWLVRVTLITAVPALVAVGFGLRQRALDEPAIAHILEARLNRETAHLAE